VTGEFSLAGVALEVVKHLERKRRAVVEDAAATAREVDEALVPIRAAYAEAELPPDYWAALEAEVRGHLPEAWRERALAFTRKERRDFDLWRGGDPLARITYVGAGLLVGSLILWAPFIPIWEKWVPFAMAFAAFWLPTLQVWWHRRRYARTLGRVIAETAQAQARLDGTIRTHDLLTSGREDDV
jgi:hypothetical protein